MGYSGGELSDVLRLQYSGNQLQDLEREELRHKDFSLGTSGADIIDGSSRGANQALIGNGGNDVITGGSGDDLLIGGAGNDNLTGGLGADTFRFGQFETGQDTINDFNVNQGDKIDLRDFGTFEIKTRSYLRHTCAVDPETGAFIPEPEAQIHFTPAKSLRRAIEEGAP